MAVVKHLSVSSIETYLRCPMLWRARYVDKVPEPPSPRVIPMRFGSAIHKGLEGWGRDGEAASMRGLFKEQWAYEVSQIPGQVWDSEIETGGRSPAGYEQLGYELLREFLERMPPHVKPYAMEQKFVVQIPEVPVPLLGYIDCVLADKDGQPAALIDFKAAKDIYSKREIEWSLQPAAYSYAFQQLYGKPPERFTFLFLRTKAGLGSGRRISWGEVPLFALQPERLFALAKKVYEQIRDDDFYPSCPAWKGPCERDSYCSGWGRAPLIEVAG